MGSRKHEILTRGRSFQTRSRKLQSQTSVRLKRTIPVTWLLRKPSPVNLRNSTDRISKPQTCREGYLLFYTEHRCRHIRLCPVRAKLTAPANDAGFRIAETISVHRGGFTLHDDKHSSYSRIQSRSGTKYLVNFAMSTLRCRLQQEFTG
ncbi:hypothetical protein Bbelb_027430 [Branchiostoma belcheri]|nr:hypothetical protein Bbelb_027430 [Branchiostoma belcheri]